MVSSTPRPYFTQGETRYPLYRKLGGPQGRSGRAENLAPPIYIHIYIYIYIYIHTHRVNTKKRELLKNPTKIEEIQEKKNLLTEIEPLQLAF